MTDVKIEKSNISSKSTLLQAPTALVKVCKWGNLLASKSTAAIAAFRDEKKMLSKKWSKKFCLYFV